PVGERREDGKVKKSRAPAHIPAFTGPGSGESPRLRAAGDDSGTDGLFARFVPSAVQPSGSGNPQPELSLCVPRSRVVCPFEDERRFDPGSTRTDAPDNCHQDWQPRLLLHSRSRSGSTQIPSCRFTLPFLLGPGAVPRRPPEPAPSGSASRAPRT